MFTDSYLYRLNIEYAKIQNEVKKATDKSLVMPRLEIVQVKGYWGKWIPSKKLIKLNESLFHDYEWGAVVYVFRHEVAHQIVNDIFEFDGVGCPHGEHFDIACSILNIPSHTCDSSDFLSNYKCMVEENPIVERIRKLYIKGNNEASTEAEQVIFMNKACQLMDKYNVKLNQVTGEDTFHMFRQLTEGYKRFPSYLHDIGNIVGDFYHVKTIQRYYFEYRDGGKRVKFAYMEMFGEPTNIEVAEYVFHALWNQANILYEEFKKNHNPVYGHKVSKAAYILGLMAGYKAKMSSHKETVSLTGEERGLMHMNDKILKDLFEKEYKVVYTKSNNRGLGYNDGKSDGYKMNVSSGVKATNNGYALC